MTSDPLWYPYAQMKTMTPPLEVASAHGVRLHLADGQELIDATASWWCAIHGYNHPELNQAARDQLERMSHVMLGGLTHRPALDFAARLVEITPDGLEHVFFSDSGSVAMEVALKLAIQSWANRGRPEKHRFLALRRAYHGDTCGVMSICDPEEGMHKLFRGFLPEQIFLAAPTPLFQLEETPNALGGDIVALEAALKAHGRQLAAFVVEPLLQAAGGLNVYAAEYLRAARQLCDKYEVLLIFDEVATGFGRTGKLFAADHAGVSPDIMALGKALTGGYVGHAATLATEALFQTFWDDAPTRAFMHGPTFMGNPLACAIGLKGLEIFQRENYLAKVARIEAILREELSAIQSHKAKETRIFGAMGVVEAYDRKMLKGLQAFAREQGVWLRPFERYAYTMPPYIIEEADLRRVTAVLRAWFD